MTLVNKHTLPDGFITLLNAIGFVLLILVGVMVVHWVVKTLSRYRN